MKIKRRSTRGQTLLELIAATMIIGATLVPGLDLMRDSLRISRQIETDTLMATLSVDKLEEYLAKTSANWQTTNLTGDYSADGYSQLNYQLIRSDSVVDGGIPGSLMMIQSTLWNDANNNGTLDSGERNVVFVSKLARVVSYELEASGP